MTNMIYSNIESFYRLMVDGTTGFVLVDKARKLWPQFYKEAQPWEDVGALAVDKLPTPEEVETMPHDSVRRLIETLGTRMKPIIPNLPDSLKEELKAQQTRAIEETAAREQREYLKI